MGDFFYPKRAMTPEGARASTTAKEGEGGASVRRSRYPAKGEAKAAAREDEKSARPTRSRAP
jgi:hypothetical protein